MKSKHFHPKINLTRTSMTPLCLQIVEQMRREIIRNRVTSETRVISERCLSEELQVSRNTVHQAYQQLSSEGYITLPEVRGSCSRISNKAQDNYRQPYPTINLILPNRMSEYVSSMRRRSLELVAGLMDHAADVGISVKILPLPSSDATAQDISLWLDSFIPRSLGIVTLGSTVQTHAGFEALLRQKEVPHVFVSGNSTYAHIGSVTVDYAPGVHKMLSHLKECGHHRLLLLDFYFKPGAVFDYCARERATVIRELAGEYGLETRSIIWHRDKVNMDELSWHLRHYAWRPTALWVHNDRLGDELLPRLADLGVRLFQDLSVVGYDDCSKKFELSSLNHSRQAMAAMAVDFVDSLFKDGKPGEALHGRVPCDYFPKSSVVNCPA